MKKLLLLGVVCLLLLLPFISSAQLMEDFESGVPPSGWTSFVGSNGEGTSYDWTTTTTSNSGSQAAFVRYESVSNEAQDWLVTSQFTPLATNSELTFFERQGLSIDYGSTFAIKVSTTSQTDINSFVDVTTYTEGDFGTSYTSRTVSLSAYVGIPIYLAFVMTNDDGDSWYIDDVLVAVPPTCGDASSGSASNVSDTQADLSWTSNVNCTGDTYWAIPTGDPTPTSGVGGTAATACGMTTVTGLAGSTTYDFYVETTCSVGTGGPVLLNTFTTLDPPPACGGNFYDSGGSSGDYGNNEEITTTICPDVSGEVVTVTFTAFNTEANYDELTVYDGDDASASNLGIFDGTSIPGPFTSTDLTGCLTFVFESDGSGLRDGWEADVTCAAPPSCPAPSSVSATNITDVSADVTFTIPGSETSFEAALFASGDDPDVDPALFTMTGSGSPISFSGLTAETAYDAYVRTDCTAASSGLSDFAGPFTFTTNAAPPINDECGGAIVLTVNTDFSCGATTSGTVEGATASPEDDVICGGTEDDDVWFSFTATASTHRIELLNESGSDLYHSVWEGTCGGLTLLTGSCSDPEVSNPSGFTIGSTYFLRVYSWSGTSGQTTTFDVCIGTPPPPPSNDLCSGAIPATFINTEGTGCGTPTILPFSTDATTDSGVPTVCSDPGKDQWFTWIATSLELTFDQSLGGPGIAIFANCSDADAGQEIACLNTLTDGSLSGWAINDELLIQIYDYQGSNSDVSFCLEEYTPPTCGDASSGSASNITETTVDLTWTSNGNCTSDAYWVIPTGNAAPTAGTGTMADACGMTALTGLMGTTTYDFYVETTCAVGTGGPILLSTFTTNAAPPANDVCGAISISCGIIDQPGTTTAGTDDNPATCGNSGDGNSAGVWYTFVGNGDIVTVTVNADPGNADDLGDSQLAIYSGSCAALDCVTGNDDSTPPGGSGSQAIFNSVVGTTYYIYVDGYSTNSGDFLISVECATPVISDGTMGACESASSATSNGSGNKVFLTDADGDVIAGFIDSESMGTVNASVYIYDGTGSRDYASDNTAGDGFDLMDRSIVITPTTQPTNPVTVFLYFTQAEVDELLLNADGDNTAPASLIGAGLNKFQTDDCADVVNPQNLNAGELITISAVNALAGGYEMVFSVSSFSGFVVAESNAAALPIKLDRFSAKEDGRHNMIEWSTSSEINVQDHTLMKSNDATNWEVLGVVAGELESNTNVDYDMIDVLPFEVTYYQLMTTDIDGSTSYSPITSVTRNSERNSQFLGASPVPTRDVVNLNVYSSGDDNITITLTDISGKRLFVDNRAISSGDHQLPLDLSDMTNGIYMVTITSDFIQQTHRVIKN